MNAEQSAHLFGSLKKFLFREPWKKFNIFSLSMRTNTDKPSSAYPKKRKKKTSVDDDD
jgi:hypothetical protein